MCLPHAKYILGEDHGKPLVVTPAFAGPPQSTLILGNALLMATNPVYAEGKVNYRHSTHTIDLVMTLLERPINMPINSPIDEDIRTPADVFVGYLALDALIGNTDRHHENWGWVVQLEGEMNVVRLAPTFDHASSLGCHETDARKESRLVSNDKNFSCAGYAARARSAFFLNAADTRPLRTHEAFIEAARRYPRAAQYWIRTILGMQREQFDILLNEVPSHRISNTSRRFALEILMSNRRTLAEVQL
jgi:hypothetical protein